MPDARLACPSCGLDVDAAGAIRGLAVCSSPCDTSIVVDTGLKATAADVLLLTPDELAQLRKARKRPKRARP